MSGRRHEAGKMNGWKTTTMTRRLTPLGDIIDQSSETNDNYWARGFVASMLFGHSLLVSCTTGHRSHFCY